MNNTVYGILALLAVSMFLSGCVQDQGDGVDVSVEQARGIAERYVKNMSEYTAGDGRNLTLVSVNSTRMRYGPESATVSIRTFTYEYDMDSEKQEGVVDRATVKVVVRGREVVNAVFYAGQRDDVVTRYGALAVSSLLENPSYGRQVRVYGKVAGLGMLLCPCFQLGSEGQKITVWYDLMEADGKTRPKVDISGIMNGDIVVVTGEVRPETGEDSLAVFWASSVEKVDEGADVVPPQPPVDDAPPVKQVPMEESLRAAEAFVRNSATYRFDGFDLAHSESVAAKCPSCWTFRFAYTSRNAGYGDRKGQALARVLTRHVAVLQVEGGEVVSAVLDGKWDMIGQKYLSDEVETVDAPVEKPPEDVKGPAAVVTDEGDGSGDEDETAVLMEDDGLMGTKSDPPGGDAEENKIVVDTVAVIS